MHYQWCGEMDVGKCGPTDCRHNVKSKATLNEPKHNQTKSREREK